MSDELIRQAAGLMAEQAESYGRIDAVCRQLSAALVRGEPSLVASLTRAGESELLRMRSRLVRITLALTAFADARALTQEPRPVSPEARASFDSSSKRLFQAAREFLRTQRRASALAGGGSTFASACIEQCGVAPTTYRAPYARSGGASPWA